MRDLSVIIGARGFGIPCARRLGAGRKILLGDVSADVLDEAGATLTSEGYDVATGLIDVSDPSSVKAFAATASGLGFVRTLVHTAGLSPRMASPERILAVNMLGTIEVMEAFYPLVGQNSVAIFMASNAANMARVPLEVEEALAMASPDELMSHIMTVQGWDTGLGAYWLAKRCNQLRVEAAAGRWGERGARILSISPGIISTAMIAHERGVGAPVADALAATPLRRIGVPDDIAAAVEWLAGPQAGYVTGTDLLIDGGMTGVIRWTGYRTENPQDAAEQIAESASLS